MKNSPPRNLIWHVLRVRQSVVSLAYWRVLLLACLLLPMCQPWRASTRPSNEGSTASGVERAYRIELASPGSTVTPTPWPWAMSDVLLVCLGAGVVARSLWLVVGACHLRRLRRTAVRLEPVPSIVREAQERIGARADVYVSDRIAGPITFGLRRPVVMVPPSVLSMDTHLQEAIASHELLHVRRRDWLNVIVEEVIRTVFWFHPAIWWLIGRIQLSREHVVDEAVIRLTQSRDRYVEALVAVALTGSPVALAPAPLFLRRRFLKKRVAHILQETTMTTRRLIASVTVSAGALALAAVLAVRSFPLEARAAQQTAPEQASSTAPIQIVTGGEHLLHGSLPEYPRRAIEKRIEGEVVLDLTVDDRGEVSDARVLSGPDELRRAALESVLQWHYSPESMRSTATQVALRFQVPAPGEEDRERQPWRFDAAQFGKEGRAFAVNQEAKAETEQRELTPGQRAERQIVELEHAMRDPAATDSQKDELKRKYLEVKEQFEQLLADRAGRPGPRFEGTARLAWIRTERVPQEIAKEITNRAGIALGDPITEATAKRIREIVTSLDEHLRVSFERDGKGGVVLTIIAP